MNLNSWISCCLCCLLLIACGNEIITDEPSGGNTIDVQFILNLHGAISPAPNSIGNPYNENSIDDIHILLFDVSGDFVSLAPIHNRTIGSNKVTCRTDLPRTGTYDIVVLANLPDALKPDKIADLRETIGTTKAEFIAWFEYNCAAGPWDMSCPIPLWGEITKKLSNVYNHGELSIDLVRSMARIDVKVDENVTDFKIQTILLYNPSQNAQIIPDPENWDATKQKVTSPTESENGYGLYSGRYLYTLDTPGNTYETQIYTPEAPAGSAPFTDGWTSNTCLVIGGYFGTSNTTATTYYRIDFTDADGSYLPLLRNHKYTINIKQVLHHGQESPETALATHHVNSIYTTMKWMSQDSDVTVEGKYHLTVNRRVAYLPKTEDASSNSTYKLIITTNQPDGWTAEVTEGIEWLSLSAYMEASGIDGVAVYLCTQTNETNADREGTIEFRAGDIKVPVKVIQRHFDGARVEWAARTDYETKNDFFLILTADLGATPEPEDITVKWSGVGDLTIEKDKQTGNKDWNAVAPFEWDPGGFTTAYKVSGICEQTYTLAPEALPSWWEVAYPPVNNSNGYLKAKRETTYYFGDRTSNASRVNAQQTYD